jgi:hypothetical protein
LCRAERYGRKRFSLRTARNDIHHPACLEDLCIHLITNPSPIASFTISEKYLQLDGWR